MDRIQRQSHFHSLGRRQWWLALGLIVIVAAVLRFGSFQFSLPYIDHPDEPNFYRTAREWRGLLDDNEYLTGYPPIYIWLNIGVQVILEPLGVQGMAATMPYLRLISVIADLGTVIAVALTARLAAGSLAGLIGGAGWALAPLVLENTVYATPDPLLYFLVSLALYLAAASLSPGREILSVWSVLVGALAILDKYFVLTAVLPGVAAIVLIARRDRGLAKRYLIVAAAILLITAAISIVGIAQLGREASTARDQGLANVLNPERVLNNLYYTLYPLEPVLFVLAVGGGALAFILALRRGYKRVDLIIAGLCLLVVISTPWLAATFSAVSANARMKDVLPGTTAAAAVIGIGIAQIVWLLPKSRQAIGAGIALAALAGLVYVPHLIQDWALVQERRLPDQRVALRQWADVNLEAGTVLVDRSNHKTFNPFWGGLEGRQWFDWWETRQITEHSVETWREENGMSYAVVSETERAELEATEDGRAYLSEMLHLRDFLEPESRGPRFSVYRLWGIEHAFPAQFGDAIHLLGYDGGAAQVQPGDVLNLRFYWGASTPPADNFSLFIHLLPPEVDLPVAQTDGAPAVPERPTLTWVDPSETLISPPFTLTIPADAPAGTYSVVIGLYNYVTGARLPVSASPETMTSPDSLRLFSLEVGR